MWEMMELPVGKVLVQAAVVWQILRVTDVLLEDRVAPLPQTMLVLLVARVAHLLVEFVVASSVCEWEATRSVLRSLFLPFGQSLVLYIHVATHDKQSSLRTSPCPQWRGGGLSNVDVVVVFAPADVGTERLTIGVGGKVRWPI